MAAVTLTDCTYLLRDVIAPSLSVLHYEENELLDYSGNNPNIGAAGERKLNGLIPHKPTDGGTSLKWAVEYANDTATEISEGDALPAPGNISVTQASQSPRYFAATLKINRHVLDAARDEAKVIDILAHHFDARMRGLMHKINTTLMGTGTGNLLAMVDETTTYAGISSRATYKWDSYEAAIGGAIALSDCEDAVEALVERGANYKDLIWVVRHNQVTNLSRLAGWSGNAVVQKYVNTGGAFDPSFLRDAIAVNGVPVHGVGTLSNTTYLLLNPRAFEWRIHKQLIVEPKETQDYSYSWMMLIALFLKCNDPYRQGKLTGATA